MGKFRKAVQQKQVSNGKSKKLTTKPNKKDFSKAGGKKEFFKTNEPKADPNSKTQIKLKSKKPIYGKKAESDSEDSDFEVAIETNQQGGRAFNKIDSAAEESKNNELEENLDTRDMVKKQNKKQKKSGGFQSMGLSYPIYKGITKKGYKVPTPIQRKTIPLIMDGKDVVAMARTGSGKTAAFLIPMFERLNTHSTKGCRALVLSPTRELAVQTMKFTKDLGKFTDLKPTLILGGDSMENQFASLHQNPDILIASPGRLLHLLVEMEIKCLDSVEYVVFDEADRLFEMGFAEQLNEIIKRLPGSRQTVLFSATLPKVLVDFASAGLTDPTLIRLDVDTKISERLKMSFFLLRPDDKTACLLHILQSMVEKNQQTLVFCSTKHHVDYIQQLLENGGFNSTYIYSSLDQTARKINIAKFRKKLSMILLVTDIAARGIDIPMLDNVINYDFPAKPKIFVHRVGRVARAGQTGTAYSFLTKEELSFYFDLHLFLGRGTKFATPTSKKEDDGLLGSVPQAALTDSVDYIRNTTAMNFNLVSMHKVMSNGYKHYLKSRELPSLESVKRSKNVDLTSISQHPVFDGADNTNELSQLLSDLQKFKPSVTVFEAMNTKMSKESDTIMKLKRQQHNPAIEHHKKKLKEEKLISKETSAQDKTDEPQDTVADDDYIANVFQIKPKKDFKDENYIPHFSSDRHEEKGFNVRTFEKEASSISLDLTTDDGKAARKNLQAKKWDRKRKKFVSTNGTPAKKIKTESGNYIAASYKTHVYSDWMKKNNYNLTKQNENNEENENSFRNGPRQFKGKMGSHSSKNSKGTLKSKDQMVKGRMKASQDNYFSSQRGSRGGGGSSRGGSRGRSSSRGGSSRGGGGGSSRGGSSGRGGGGRGGGSGRGGKR